MKHKTFLTAVSGALLTGTVLFAGGTSYDARIVSFSRVKGDKATFIVEGRSEDIMPGCRSANVTTDFLVWNLPWDGDPLITRKTHREALDRLKKASASGGAIRFGLLGSGLHPEPQACTFRSKGLVVLAED